MLNKINGLFYYLFKAPFYKLTLGNIGKGSKLVKPTLSEGKRIFIGSKVYINLNAWLACVSLTGDTNCKLIIGDGTYIGRFSHIYATSKIEIGKKVLMADGAWLGENVCVIGASIGKNSVVGANSVVTKDIPDHCVAIGSPAVIIKRYNFDEGQWQKTDKDGQFI